MVADAAWNSTAGRHHWVDEHAMPTGEVQMRVVNAPAPVRTPADIYAPPAEEVQRADTEPQEPEGGIAERGDGVFRHFQQSHGLHPQCPSGFEVRVHQS